LPDIWCYSKYVHFFPFWGLSFADKHTSTSPSFNELKWCGCYPVRFIFGSGWKFAKGVSGMSISIISAGDLTVTAVGLQLWYCCKYDNKRSCIVRDLPSATSDISWIWGSHGGEYEDACLLG
jgi:hypothetical protein